MEQHEHSVKFRQDQGLRESGGGASDSRSVFFYKVPHPLRFSALMQTPLGPRLEEERRKRNMEENII